MQRSPALLPVPPSLLPLPLPPQIWPGGARPLPALPLLSPALHFDLERTEKAKQKSEEGKGKPSKGGGGENSEDENDETKAKVDEEPEPPGKQKPPPPKEASPFVRNYVFAPADKQHVMTGRGKAFHAGNQPPFTMEAFFRPPWIYPLMAWIFTMFMWAPNLGPGAVK